MPELKRYQNTRLQDQLAVRYVTGDLTVLTRKRFEKLLSQYPEIQLYVTSWVERLQPLNEKNTPVTSPRLVLTNFDDSVDKSKPSIWSNIVFWRSAAIVATVVLVVALFLKPLEGTSVERRTQHVAFIVNKNAQIKWAIKAVDHYQRVVVTTMATPAPGADNICVLWLRWKNGKTRSVGILPEMPGKEELWLPEDLSHNPGLADVVVSIESSGNVRSEPQGEVVFQGPWLEL